MPPMCEDMKPTQPFCIEISTLTTSKKSKGEGNKLMLQGLKGNETVGDITMIIVEKDKTAPTPDRMKIEYEYKGKLYDLTCDVRRSLLSCGINKDTVLTCHFLAENKAKKKISDDERIPIHSALPPRQFSLTVQSLTGNEVVMENLTGRETIVDILRRYEKKTSFPAWSITLIYKNYTLSTEYWRTLISYGIIEDTTLKMVRSLATQPSRSE
uniref:Ubiquitin-like domain-containing protein n=1 Tax=Lotharella globosa TaxID=91324 RepID=A0A7S3Z9N8_9EUKA